MLSKLKHFHFDWRIHILSSKKINLYFKIQFFILEEEKIRIYLIDDELVVLTLRHNRSV